MGKYKSLYRGTVKRFLYLLLVLAITLSATPGIAAAGNLSFKDIDDQQPSWPYVNYLSNEGATSGYPDGTFRPQEGTTRAQLA
ncbi:MAG: S-layer homology domain-containing protein, partial [Bacillota bacterium]